MNVSHDTTFTMCQSDWTNTSPRRRSETLFRYLIDTFSFDQRLDRKLAIVLVLMTRPDPLPAPGEQSQLKQNQLCNKNHLPQVSIYKYLSEIDTDRNDPE